MFKKNQEPGKREWDFRVSLIGFNGKTARIRIGPRFLNSAFDSFSLGEFPGSTKIPQRDGILSDFYSVDFSPPGKTIFSIFESLKKDRTLGGVGEISRYFPASVDSLGNLREERTGGVFSIQADKTIYFWMKIPIGNYIDPVFSVKKELELYTPRIEYGSVVAANPAYKTDDRGGILRVSNIPFLSINVGKVGFNLEYFDIGEIKYSSTNWIEAGKQVPYRVSQLSSFFS
jgi:hypothetical protein